MLTAHEKKILRDSWRLVTPIMETASDLFYRKLFELQPAYRALFPDDMSSQKRKLMVTLAFVVKAADWADESWADSVAEKDDLFLVVLALGRRHAVLYHVPDESYPVVGEALIWALDMGLGEAFTAETRATWLKLYGLLSATMRLGAHNATAAPAAVAAR
jgi:hemoglobin-like flavoprotein